MQAPEVETVTLVGVCAGQEANFLACFSFRAAPAEKLPAALTLNRLRQNVDLVLGSGQCGTWVSRIRSVASGPGYPASPPGEAVLVGGRFADDELPNTGAFVGAPPAGIAVPVLGLSDARITADGGAMVTCGSTSGPETLGVLGFGANEMLALDSAVWAGVPLEDATVILDHFGPSPPL